MTMAMCQILMPAVPATARKQRRKKKGKILPSHSAALNKSNSLSPTLLLPPSNSFVHPPPPPPPPPPPALCRTETQTVQRSSISKDRIWNTSTQEERERIKEFWLSLGEDERKSLVKIEKEAVLRKMKEQQKHSCSCTVCGRKRTAIEEELEVLYDAYYEELESYANHQQNTGENGTHMLPPPRRYAQQQPGRIPSDQMPPLLTSHSPRDPLDHHLDDEEEDEEEHDDEEEDSDEEDFDETYSDSEVEEIPRGAAGDFFTFGNSLTVKGGILTVADDLLQNDGKKFIEMMEQLAERRIQREEDAQYSATYQPTPVHSHNHNHPGSPIDDEYDDEEEEDFDSQEEDYGDDEDMDTMTDEQRMEEGRRMFQIFAARMFEQRVLTAYREKVARERQQKLLEELEEESRLDVEREAKKARDAQRKKDKKALQKQAKAEEKARQEAKRAAEESEARKIEVKRQEELRRRKEEQRKKKEAERKAIEGEKQRKDAVRNSRIQEERERQQEFERRAREQKSLEKKAREGAKRKEREEREAREKEARERKANQDCEKRERETRSRIERETKERIRKEEQGVQALHNVSQLPKRPSQPQVSLQPHRKTSLTVVPSPHVAVATPAILKAPTPVRPRRGSRQGSRCSSPGTSQVPPNASNSISPPSSVPRQVGITAPTTILLKSQGQNQPQVLQPSTGPPPGIQSHAIPGFNDLPPGVNGFPSIGQRIPISWTSQPTHPNTQAPMNPSFRPFPSTISGPPGIGGSGILPPCRGYPLDPPPGFGQPIHGMGTVHSMPGLGSVGRDSMAPNSHSRQHSSSFEKPLFEPQIGPPTNQPIQKPAPIQRPSSVKPNECNHEGRRPIVSQIDDLSNHLGSRALLDDDDDAEMNNTPGGMVRRLNYRNDMRSRQLLFQETSNASRIDSFPRSGAGSGLSKLSSFPPPAAIGPGQQWCAPPASVWPNPASFGVVGGHHRPSISRPVSIRLLVCQACKSLASDPRIVTPDGFIEVPRILHHVQLNQSTTEPAVQIQEILDIFETEGDIHNGGGSFSIKREGPSRMLVKYEPGNNPHSRIPIGVGEIGSPIRSHSVLAGPYGTGGTNSVGSAMRMFPNLGHVSSGPGFS